MRWSVRMMCAATLLLPAAAQAMSVADFLAKADALKAKGVLALLSPDLSALKTEGTAATKAWRAQATPPRACPPPSGKMTLTSDEFLAMLTVVPPGQRAATSVTQAVTAGFNRRFPCGAKATT